MNDDKIWQSLSAGILELLALGNRVDLGDDIFLSHISRQKAHISDPDNSRGTVNNWVIFPLSKAESTEW